MKPRAPFLSFNNSSLCYNASNDKISRCAGYSSTGGNQFLNRGSINCSKWLLKRIRRTTPATGGHSSITCSSVTCFLYSLFAVSLPSRPLLLHDSSLLLLCPKLVVAMIVNLHYTRSARQCAEISSSPDPHRGATTQPRTGH